MTRIDTYQGYAVYWEDPNTDNGHGSGEVMVGSDSVGAARTHGDAIRMAQEHVRKYLAKLGR